MGVNQVHIEFIENLIVASTYWYFKNNCCRVRNDAIDVSGEAAWFSIAACVFWVSPHVRDTMPEFFNICIITRILYNVAAVAVGAHLLFCFLWIEFLTALSGGFSYLEKVLAEDAENWQYFKLCGNGLKIKKGVVPHKYLTSMCPDKGSQFSDEDKKLKLEFMNSLMNDRKIVTRVNRLEDLKTDDGSSSSIGLEKLAKNNARIKYNAPSVQFMEHKPDTLQVTPDIYICSCVHDSPISHDAYSDDRNQCSQTTDAYVQVETVVFGATTGDPGSEDPPAAAGPKKKPKPKKVVPEVESEGELSETEVSLLDGDYSDVDPDYDPDSDGGGGDDDRNPEQLKMKEVWEDDLMRKVRRDETRASGNRTNRRASERKAPQKSAKPNHKKKKKVATRSVKSRKSNPKNKR